MRMHETHFTAYMLGCSASRCGFTQPCIKMFIYLQRFFLENYLYISCIITKLYQNLKINNVAITTRHSDDSPAHSDTLECH